MIADSVSTLPAPQTHPCQPSQESVQVPVGPKRMLGRLGGLALALTLGLTSCLQVQDSAPAPQPAPAQEPIRSEVAAPLSSQVDSLEVAKTHPLPAMESMEFDTLHNVFWLGDRILSGGEPLDHAALDQLASMGIRTILSVDGKAPDWRAAQARGMRYVHIPIQYSGIEAEPLDQITKTFREFEGPFYVHCFHGKHRGPAAAAIGRIVLDGVSREEALAEMRQWCGTAEKYTGLFDEVAFTEISDAETTAAMEFDFPKEHSFQGVRAAMIPMTRHWDNIKDARRRDWQEDPAHPDLVVQQEAVKLAGTLQQCVEMEDYHDDMPRSEQVQTWFREGAEGASKLAAVLAARDQYEAKGEDWRPLALEAYREVAASCKACHLEYRD